MSQNRITLEMNSFEAVVALAEGNPGAAIALMELMNSAEQIDPDSALGEMSPAFSFDTYGIYGSHIHILFSDICKKDPVKTLAVLRSVQMGIFSQSILKEACSRQNHTGSTLVPVDELLTKVREQLPNFASSIPA
jgi:hypothetical protein